MILQTDRLTLREFIFDDWRFVHEYAADEDLVQYMDWGPNSEEDTKAFVRAMLGSQTADPRQTFGFVIIANSDDTLIGGCELAVKENSQGSIGYCLNRSFWGQGYATEAALALLRFGFLELHLHRIFATCRPENIASAKVMEKIGMKREGMLREHFFAKGEWQCSFLYSILAHEYSEDYQSNK